MGFFGNFARNCLGGKEKWYNKKHCGIYESEGIGMPVLDWIGKSRVVNHHLDVPYRVLACQYSFDENGRHEGDNGSENMIIHGDNLLALKSLLPQYEGRVKCIYIDPPYNTGNEGWVYNDNVNDPQIKKWLGDVVGKEGEDLSRHDKWLCMMYPRLKLLQRLLADDGVIFISIDDNEVENLKIIGNEIFGKSNFIAQIVWQKTYSPRNDSKGISTEAEYIIALSKTPLWTPQKLARTEKMNAVYKNPDNDFSLWRNSDAFAPSASTHQGMVYAIQHPFTGNYIYPYNGACWPLEQGSMLEEMSKWANYKLVEIDDAAKRAEVCGVSVSDIRQGVKAIVLDEPLESAREKVKKIYERGQWPKFFFTRNGEGGIARKTYLDETSGKVVTNFWPFEEVGHTDEAKKELKGIFGGKVFDTPKPVRLIDRILSVAADKDAIILDSFAGSGTTAHAVLNLNKEDGGHRKFILVEMGDYAESITAERVKRVICGYKAEEDKEIAIYDEELRISNLDEAEDMLKDAKKAKKEAKDSGMYDRVGNPKISDNHLQVIATVKATEEIVGTGGSFRYFELGDPIFIGDRLNEDIGEDEIRKYVYFTETKQPLEARRADESSYMGTHYGTAYYFHYKRDAVTTLSRAFLHTVKTRAEGYVIYADLCTLSAAELDRYHIVFKKIPRDISRL